MKQMRSTLFFVIVFCFVVLVRAADKDVVLGVTIVRYNISGNEFIARFCTKEHGVIYFRIIYAPFGPGFDAPPLEPDQELPEEIFENKERTWYFLAHLAESSEENSRCGAIPHKLLIDKNKKMSVVYDYTSIPGCEKMR